MYSRHVAGWSSSRYFLLTRAPADEHEGDVAAVVGDSGDGRGHQFDVPVTEGYKRTRERQRRVMCYVRAREQKDGITQPDVDPRRRPVRRPGIPRRVLGLVVRVPEHHPIDRVRVA